MLSPDENEQIDIADLPGVKAVATGVLGEGSCFFHSVILGLSPSEYLGLPRADRTEYAGKLRGIIADGITVDYWLGLESTQIYLAENIRVILTSLSTNKTYKKKSSIIDAIKASPDFVPPQSAESIDAFVSSIALVINDIAVFRAKLTEFIISRQVADAIVDKLVEHGYNLFVRLIRNVYTDIGDGEFGFIAEKFHVFLIFINPDGSMYKYGATKADLGRSEKVLIIKYIPGHFENIGLVVGNTIHRSFDKSDPIIAPLLAVAI